MLFLCYKNIENKIIAIIVLYQKKLRIKQLKVKTIQLTRIFQINKIN